MDSVEDKYVRYNLHIPPHLRCRVFMSDHPGLWMYLDVPDQTTRLFAQTCRSETSKGHNGHFLRCLLYRGISLCSTNGATKLESFVWASSGPRTPGRPCSQGCRQSGGGSNCARPPCLGEQPRSGRFALEEVGMFLVAFLLLVVRPGAPYS